jgi:hypothetical protein
MRGSGFVAWVTAVVAVLGMSVVASAETPTERRLRILEEQLRRAQQEIEQLKGQVQQQKAIGAAAQKEADERKVEEAKRAEEDRKLDEVRRAGLKKGQLPIWASYGIGKGLTVQSDDGKFQVSVYNRFQGRYTGTDQDDPEKDDTSSFRVRRMKTTFEGHAFSPTLLYKFQVNWAGSPELEDAYAHWVPRKYAGFQVGQYKVPFNRQQLTSSGAQQFVDRAITDDFFTFARDQGATVTGSWFGPKSDMLEWNAGIFNGNGINRASNENSDHLGVARVLFMPLGGFKYYSESDTDDSQKPLLGIGAAYAFNSQADAAATEKARILSSSRLGGVFGSDFGDRVDISQGTVDAHFKYRGVSVLGDYYWAQADPNHFPSEEARGYNFQAGYFILPKRLEAALRYALVDRNIDEEDAGVREIGGALGYFFLAHNLKIQADVRSLSAEVPGGPDQDIMEYRAQVQVIF